MTYFSSFNIFILIFVFFLFEGDKLAAEIPVNSSEIKLLLSRLDLENSQLAFVKHSPEYDEKSAELLKYYKHRQHVKHPEEKKFKESSLGSYVDEEDIKIANDALRHYFIGQRAYPAYFVGEDINWETRPVPDNEWIWQLNRMYFWDAMARVYVQTGDEKYAKEWCEQLVDWTRKNPNDEIHQYAWRSIEAGIRGYRWTGLFQQFIKSPSFTTDVLIAFLNSCYDHAEYLMTKYSTRSNWGLMEAEGLAFIAVTFPEFKKAENWKDEAFRRLNNEINIQVYPDGHQRELAMGYHLGCISWFLRTYELARMNGMDDAFPESYLQKVEKMCEVPMKLCHPDGTNVQFGDAWAGSPGQHHKRFAEWAEIFNRDDFLFLATAGEDGNRPDSTAYAFPFSGLYSMRSGWEEDAVCLVLKCGPDGGGHCQPDNGTFELFAGGRNLMPDGGSYIYSGNPEGRSWFRQTKVHQTLTLDGKNSGYHPKLILWNPSDSLDVLVVENNSYKNLIHRRSVYFINKKYFVIVDEARGEATGNIDLHFQLAPGEAIFDYNDFSVASGFDEGWNVKIHTLPQEGMKLEKEEGWVSFLYTVKEQRPAFRYRLVKEKENEPVRFVTLLTPYEQVPPQVDIKIDTGSEGDIPSLEIRDKGRRMRLPLYSSAAYAGVN